jgi:hypothetical protein
MIAFEARAARLRLALLLAAGLPLQGCTSTPFGSASDFDRTFIGAAQTWDLDKNSIVTCEEWKQYATTSLREADANGDGALDATEFGAMARTDRLFEVANLSYYDSNGDGRASLDELAGKSNLAFKLLDKNGDCQIDRNESVQIVATDKPKDKAKDGDQQIPSPGGGGGRY